MKCLPLLLAILFVSCTSKKNRDYEAEDLLSIYEPKWFSASEKHSLRDANGNLKPHLFFDVSPEFTEREQLTNVVITTTENSYHAYNVDLVSGQRYYAHSYCNQTDAWNKRSGTYGRPYFSLAYMPRVLDQMGDPQKVIVFGGNDRLTQSLDHHFVRVRLIGGYLEENCLEVNCLGRDNWTSRLVFIAVDPQDSKYRDVVDIETFRNTQSWDKLQTTLQNLDGRNFSVDRTFPFTRVRDLISYKDMIPLFRKRSAFMSDTELQKIQKSCHMLYDKLWTEVGEDRPEDRIAKTEAELRAKLKVRDELRENKKPVGKMARFRPLVKKYFSEIATCEKFVYHGNINLYPDHFWFHSYVGMFIRLHREGYYFDCTRKIWAENIYDINGNPAHYLPDEIEYCTDKDMDLAIEYMPNHLKAMKAVFGSYYRFIDYDTHEFGTHRKLYSWVKMHRRKFDCRPDPTSEIIEKLQSAPEDVSWKRWEVIDVAKDLKIIY